MNHGIKRASLRILGNILCGDEKQTDAVLKCKVLENFSKLLNSGKQLLQAEVCWAISNILGGPIHQIQAVIDANLIPPLLTLLDNSPMSVRMEAAWAIGNFCVSGSPKQIEYVFKKKNFITNF